MENFTNKEIQDINLLVLSRKKLYDDTIDIRSMFEASKKMYSDDSAFIFELIQNADDCGAKNIKISIEKEKLYFEHDGRNFELKDIKQITKASSEDNEKATDEGKIGQFGIGFKSVFNITTTPEITSGKYKFQIKDYVIPYFLVPDIDSECSDFSYSESNNTVIELPFIDFNKYEITKKRLESMSDKHILFLNNVICVEISINDETRVIRKENISNDLFGDNENLKKYEEVLDSEKITLVNIIDKYYLISSGLVLSPSEDEEKFYRNIKIAFEMNKENSKYTFVPAKESNYFVFFPTNTPTGLNFYIQGKYTVGMNRKELNNANQDFFKDINNANIIKITCRLLQRTLDIFSQFGLTNKELLNVIIQEKQSQTQLGKQIRECIQEYFKTSNKFLTSDECNNINNMLFTDDIDVIDIFSANDIYEGHFWIKKEYVEFYKFFSEIENLKLIDLNFIKEKIKTDKIILDKVNNKKLYKYLLKHRDKILDLEFIKTTIGTYEKIDCPHLYSSNSIQNLDEIQNEIKEKIGLDFNPLFIEENLNKEIGIIDKFKKLEYDSIIDFIDEKFFLLGNEAIKNVKQYFSGFNIILKLLKMSRKKIELKNVPLLTKNEDKRYIKASKKSAYYIENQMIKSLYIKTGALKESDFIDTNVYEENVTEDLKDMFKKFISECEVKKDVIKKDIEKCTAYKFYNSGSQKLFDSRQQQERDSYFCEVYNPSIENADTILRYLSTKGNIEDSITFFHIMVDFFSNVDYENTYFEHYYKKWNKVYLEEIDLLTMLKEFKWIQIEECRYKSKQVSFEKLKANGYLESVKEQTKLIKFCSLIGINNGAYSKDAIEALKLIEEMDIKSLEIIKCRVDSLLESKVS